MKLSYITPMSVVRNQKVMRVPEKEAATSYKILYMCEGGGESVIFLARSHKLGMLNTVSEAWVFFGWGFYCDNCT